MSNTPSTLNRFGRTLTLALCAGLLLAAAGQAAQSAKAPAGAKPPKHIQVKPGTLDKGAAALSSPLSCANLFVVVQDASSPQASIAKVSCDHGYFVYSVPGVSNPGQPSVLLFQQSAVYGPDCTITVSKGSATAVLSVQQNYCAAEAGNITASVTSGSATLNGSATGSFAGAVPGLVWFTIN
jgi:hypothetical protein